MSYKEAIRQAAKDLDVITRNSDVFPMSFANGFAWGEAYAISAEHPQHDTEDVYKNITEDNVLMLKYENRRLRALLEELADLLDCDENLTTIDLSEYDLSDVLWTQPTYDVRGDTIVEKYKLGD